MPRAHPACVRALAPPDVWDSDDRRDDEMPQHNGQYELRVMRIDARDGKGHPRVPSAACQGEHRAVVRIGSAKQVARPIVFGMAIIMVVFLPVLALEGIEGKMFRPMAWTFIFALGGALLIALTLSPVLGYYFLPKRVREREGLVARAMNGVFSWLLAVALRRIDRVLQRLLARLHGGQHWLEGELREDDHQDDEDDERPEHQAALGGEEVDGLPFLHGSDGQQVDRHGPDLGYVIGDGVHPLMDGDVPATDPGARRR